MHFLVLHFYALGFCIYVINHIKRNYNKRKITKTKFIVRRKEKLRQFTLCVVPWHVQSAAKRDRFQKMSTVWRQNFQVKVE